MIHVYTGKGKGKTTAAIGLAVRAASHHKVLFVQFMKNGESSEIEGLKKLGIDIKVFGNGTWVKDAKNKEQEDLVERGFDYLTQKSSSYEVVIADELITALSLKLVSEGSVIKLMKSIAEERELILTGRAASRKVIDAADLVTEMKCIKHYYDKGIKARKGIEL